MRWLQSLFLFFLLLAGLLAAQDVHQDTGRSVPGQPSQTMASMPNMSASKADNSDQPMNMSSHSLIALLQEHGTSGTDAEPDSTRFAVIMTARGDWMLMFHGAAFLNDIQQSGPRGGDKLFSTNWLMPMAQRKLANGTLTLRTMLSFEPATISDRSYPELFQQGETAFGGVIVDGQHPHNFFMELAALYDYQLSDQMMLSFYAAPVGDPAMGPIAYPHRASASEDPIAPLGHHLQDSTHIADDVITFGITQRNLRLEVSGFHGREPNEHRWEIDAGGIDSWSTRVTLNLRQNWSSQYSIAQLHSPEALFPNEDVRRMTASLMYNRPMRHGNWDSTILWGRNQGLSERNVGNGYLLESTLQFSRNFVWTRIENVDRTNELLVGANPLPMGFTERYFARVQACTFGFDREVGHLPHLATAIGGQFMWYGVPEVLKPLYGSQPMGGVVFLRVRAR